MPAKDFIELAEKNHGENIKELLTKEAIKTLKKKPGIGEQNSWKHSLPALAQVLQKANLSDQLVILEYCPPSRDKNPSRIDAVICGVDSNGKVNAVLIELKQWSSEIYEANGNFVAVRIGTSLKYKIHPRKQIEEYRNHMKNILEICHDTDAIIFSAFAYLHNAAYLDEATKHVLYGKGEFDEDSRLYTKDFSFALANKLRTFVGGGNGELAFQVFQKVQIHAIQNLKLLPKRPNYTLLKIRKSITADFKNFFMRVLELFILVFCSAIGIGFLLWLAFR